MWYRQTLKDHARQVFYANYWKSVLVSFILTLTLGTSFNSSSSSILDDESETLNQLSFDALLLILATFFVIVLIILLVATILKTFVFSPLEVGCRLCLLEALEDAYNLGTMGFAFKNNYVNIVKTQFLKNLFLGFWYLLFIIPGIIKTYEYRMIPYILAENPGMATREVFARSKKMMEGEKWNAFILDISFIGWNLLSLLTCGILNIFYVNPYYQLTCAALYHTLSEKCFRDASYYVGS